MEQGYFQATISQMVKHFSSSYESRSFIAVQPVEVYSIILVLCHAMPVHRLELCVI